MKNLIKAEWYKLKKMTAYKVLLVSYLFLEAAIQMNNISNSVVYPQYNPTYTGVEWLSDLHQTSFLYSIVIFIFTSFLCEWRFRETYLLYQPFVWHIA